MSVLIVYLIVCYVLSLPIILFYYWFTRGVRPGFWDKHLSGTWVKVSGKLTWPACCMFFMLAPVTVPWWIIVFVWANFISKD